MFSFRSKAATAPPVELSPQAPEEVLSAGSKKAMSDRDAASMAEPPSAEDLSAWLRRVHEAQSKQLTPERRKELQDRAEQSRRKAANARKCKALSSNAKRSNALAREGLRQMATYSASAAASLGSYEEVTRRWETAQEASEAFQTSALARIEEASSRPMGMVTAYEEEADEDEEGAINAVAGLMGAGSAALMLDDSNAAAAVAPRASEADELLNQLRHEPKDASECAAKFQLYEGYAQQVEKIRKTLFDFHQESVAEVPPAVAREMQARLRQVDSQEAMGIPDETREWFVFHMMRVADSNNRTMAATLEGFQKKLEFLASNDQKECPVCLEAFQEIGPHTAETLSCCHRICSECWAHWKQVQGSHVFCPLCRNEDFLEVIASRASFPI
mmetsp:Transcript_6998/g.19855  ORF Transcript_6998/g.19855 Transcript_6998/m.19855 type:complete len:388 (+) Transcript_6998:86-1249(+)